MNFTYYVSKKELRSLIRVKKIFFENWLENTSTVESTGMQDRAAGGCPEGWKHYQVLVYTCTVDVLLIKTEKHLLSIYKFCFFSNRHQIFLYIVNIYIRECGGSSYLIK